MTPSRAMSPSRSPAKVVGGVRITTFEASPDAGETCQTSSLERPWSAITARRELFEPSFSGNAAPRPSSTAAPSTRAYGGQHERIESLQRQVESLKAQLEMVSTPPPPRRTRAHSPGTLDSAGSPGSPRAESAHAGGEAAKGHEAMRSPAVALEDEQKWLQTACRAARRNEAEAHRQRSESPQPFSVLQWVSSLRVAELIQRGLTRFVDRAGGADAHATARAEGSRYFHYLAELGCMAPEEGRRAMRWLLQAEDEPERPTGVRAASPRSLRSSSRASSPLASPPPVPRSSRWQDSHRAGLAGEEGGATVVDELAHRLWDGAWRLHANGSPEDHEARSSLQVLLHELQDELSAELTGEPDPSLLKGMKQEHCFGTDSLSSFCPNAWGIKSTNPTSEWKFVMDPGARGCCCSAAVAVARWPPPSFLISANPLLPLPPSLPAALLSSPLSPCHPPQSLAHRLRMI